MIFVLVYNLLCTFMAFIVNIIYEVMCNFKDKILNFIIII